jgi:branched-chain amino acid transport system substrate-binding protein
MATPTGMARPLALTALALSVLLLGSACASTTSGTTAAAGASTGSASTGSASTGPSGTTAGGPASKCGLGNGQKATGTPIILGAIVTNIPGLSFTDATNMAAAYFECVNDNGGIHGRPIDYIVKQDALDPQQTAALASELINTDHVEAMVGSLSVLDCSVNGALYAKEHFSVIDEGSSLECFDSQNIAPVNDGPSYSALATAQYLLSEGAKSLVIFTSNTPGSNAINQSIVDLANQAHVPVHASVVAVPLSNPTGLTLQAVQEAGPGGGVVINVNAGEAIKVLEAAQQQNLVNTVKWGCPAGCNDTSFSNQLSSVWDGKLGVNAEVNLTDSTGPDNTLYRQIQKQYAPGTAVDDFSQLGFLAARIAVSGLLAVPPSQLETAAGINAALRAIKDFKSDLYCTPWYFGDQPYHAANNVTRTITPHNGAFVLTQGCKAIPALPDNNFAAIRSYAATLNGS